jgi:hypothetical protein
VILGYPGWTVSVASTVALLLFVASLLILPSASAPPIDPPHKRVAVAAANDIAQRRELLPAARRLADAARANVVAAPLQTATMPKATNRQLLATHGRADSRPLSIGFYVTWDDSSFASLQAALPKVVPSWLELTGPELELKTGVDKRSVELLGKQKQRPSVLPMLQNATDGKWDGPGLGRLLADPAKRQARIDAQGLVIDFEEVPKDAHGNMLAFLRELRTTLAPHGWLVAIAAPFDDPDWTYRSYAAATDYEILMAYDEPFEEGSPGPIDNNGFSVNEPEMRLY